MDTTLFANHTGERRPLFLSVGRFESSKNAEFLIRALAASRTKPRLLWIANSVDAGHEQRMRQLAAELGVAWELRVGIPDAELIEHYQGGLAMLYAPRLEPFGLAPLEANACGMPVIALAEGGMRETVVPGENGWLVDAQVEMAARVDELVDDPVRARAMGQRAAAYVRRQWNLELASLRLEDRLLRIVAGHRKEKGGLEGRL